MTGYAGGLRALLFGERLLHTYHRLSHSFAGECGQVSFGVLLVRVGDGNGPIPNVAVGAVNSQIFTDLHHGRHNNRWIRILGSGKSQGCQKGGTTKQKHRLFHFQSFPSIGVRRQKY